MIEKLEDRIAQQTEAGREALAVWRKTLAQMSGEAKLLKALELTETTRELMKAGLRADHPDKSEAELHEIYVDRLLSFHGYSLAQIRKLQAEQEANEPT
ncbi:MAG: hypothetical protein KDB27_20875 [Planctomycetales bacterium]|nr:hypothetical protein [Planctomycetales bacterium]